MAKNVLVLKHFETPKESGTYHRLIGLTGQNKGEAYILVGNRIVIGRSEKADIRILDTKASREHAEITRVGQNWIVTDLGSQNGIVVNDKKLTQKELVEGDKLIVGQTVFKFTKVEVSQKAKINLVQENPNVEENKKRGMLPVLVIGLLLLALVFIDSEPTNTTQKKKSAGATSVVEDVSNEYLQLERKKAKENKEAKAKLNIIYQRGLREFREGNYFRAIHEFNLALIVLPGDPQAEFYLRKTKEELDKQIEQNVQKAQIDEQALKYQHAIKNYCAIIRLLYNAPEDPRYKSAVQKINSLEELLNLEQNETDCIKKPSSN